MTFLEKESIDAYTNFLRETHEIEMLHSNKLMDEFLQFDPG